jgi:hypothetical protein
LRSELVADLLMLLLTAFLLTVGILFIRLARRLS